MKKIALSLTTILALVALLSGATWAFFTDTETSTVATFTAGTLELDINKNGATSPFSIGLGNVTLNPGEETDTATISIKNGGTINLAWFGYFTFGGNEEMQDYVYIKEAKTEFLNPDSGKWEETDKFIKDGTGNTDPGDDGHPWNTYFTDLANNHGNGGKVTLAAWNDVANNLMGAGPGVQTSALKPGGYEYRFTFKLAMLDDAPNTIQGQALSLEYTLTSTQVTQAALNSLSNADPRLQDNLGNTLLNWLNDQLGKQGNNNF